MRGRKRTLSRLGRLRRRWPPFPGTIQWTGVIGLPPRAVALMRRGSEAQRRRERRASMPADVMTVMVVPGASEMAGMTPSRGMMCAPGRLRAAHAPCQDSSEREESLTTCRHAEVLCLRGRRFQIVPRSRSSGALP